MFPRNLRYLTPVMYDRVAKLMVGKTIDLSPYKDSIKLIAVTRNEQKFTDILKKVEKVLLSKYSKFNFFMENVPSRGISCETDEMVPIGYDSMRDTLRQFGKLASDILLIQGKVYAQFKNTEDSERTHKLLNNMKMGNNIIRTGILI